MLAKVMARLAAALVALVLAVPAAVAADSAAIVTVTGAVAKPNRPAFDAFGDGFFNFHNITFSKAHAFTRPELEALGMQSVTLRYGNWPAAISFRGPRLRDVLAAAGAAGGSVTTTALDGYAAAFSAAALQGDEVLLAIEADGQPLAVGGRGPAWLVFPPGTVPGQAADTDSGLAWAVFHIKVE